MKNNKAFTLIELMAVITILSIIAIIMIPVLDKTIKKSKQEMYDIQIENIRIAGQNYYVDNITLRPTEGNNAFVSQQTLETQNYIKTNIKNPKTGTNFTNLYIEITNDNGKYIYKVCPIETCDAYE